MNDFVIIPDSGCDLTTELREKFGIDDILAGIIYFPDGHQDYADIDWKKMSPQEYYGSMKGRTVLYKTAYPPAGDTMAKFEHYLKQGKDVLSLSLSSGVSGTYQTACLVAKELMEKYPERKVICVDTLRYSGAFSLLVMKAAEKRAEGAGIEETAEYINEIREYKPIHTIEKALDNDLASWTKINEIRKSIAKDSTHYECLFTRIKKVMKEDKYKEASALSVELEEKIEILRKMYHDYTKNILDF